MNSSEFKGPTIPDAVRSVELCLISIGSTFLSCMYVICSKQICSLLSVRSFWPLFAPTRRCSRTSQHQQRHLECRTSVVAVSEPWGFQTMPAGPADPIVVGGTFYLQVCPRRQPQCREWRWQRSIQRGYDVFHWP